MPVTQSVNREFKQKYANPKWNSWKYPYYITKASKTPGIVQNFNLKREYDTKDKFLNISNEESFRCKNMNYEPFKTNFEKTKLNKRSKNNQHFDTEIRQGITDSLQKPKEIK